jgi:hypothetical protein
VKTIIKTDEFEVDLDDDRYNNVVVSSLGGNPKISIDRTEYLSMSGAWDTIYAVADRDTIKTILTGAAFTGTAIAAGTFGEIGKAIYARIKKLIIGCNHTHRQKCKTIKEFSPHADWERLGLGVDIHFKRSDDSRYRFDLSFRICNLDKHKNIIDDESSDRHTQALMIGFENKIAPVIVKVLSKFPDAGISLDLNTKSDDYAAGGAVSIDIAQLGFGVLTITPGFEIDLGEKSDELRSFLRPILERNTSQT